MVQQGTGCHGPDSRPINQFPGAGLSRNGQVSALGCLTEHHQLVNCCIWRHLWGLRNWPGVIRTVSGHLVSVTRLGNPASCLLRWFSWSFLNQMIGIWVTCPRDRTLIPPNNPGIVLEDNTTVTKIDNHQKSKLGLETFVKSTRVARLLRFPALFVKGRRQVELSDDPRYELSFPCHLPKVDNTALVICGTKSVINGINNTTAVVWYNITPLIKRDECKLTLRNSLWQMPVSDDLRYFWCQDENRRSRRCSTWLNIAPLYRGRLHWCISQDCSKRCTFGQQGFKTVHCMVQRSTCLDVHPFWTLNFGPQSTSVIKRMATRACRPFATPVLLTVTFHSYAG
jgi:hypothetical protein